MNKNLLLILLGLAACDPSDDKLPPESLPPGDSGGEAVDEDGDGSPAGEDCDDTDPAVSPSAEERCDGIDNDCDGAVDDDATDATARKEAVKVLGVALDRLAEGDLTASVETAFAGDLEKLRTAYNSTVEQFRAIVGRLRYASGSLKTATGEILSGANDLADRTTKQAAAVEETSASEPLPPGSPSAP